MRNKSVRCSAKVRLTRYICKCSHRLIVNCSALTVVLLVVPVCWQRLVSHIELLGQLIHVQELLLPSWCAQVNLRCLAPQVSRPPVLADVSQVLEEGLAFASCSCLKTKPNLKTVLWEMPPPETELGGDAGARLCAGASLRLASLWAVCLVDEANVRPDLASGAPCSCSGSAPRSSSAARACSTAVTCACAIQPKHSAQTTELRSLLTRLFPPLSLCDAAPVLEKLLTCMVERRWSAL